MVGTDAKGNYLDGKADGWEWAGRVKHIMPEGLARVAYWIESSCRNGERLHGPGWHWWQPMPGVDADPREVFAFVYLGSECVPETETADAFWQESLGDQAQRAADPDYLRGIGEAAVTFWRAGY